MEMNTEQITIGCIVQVNCDYADETTGVNLRGWKGIVRLIFQGENTAEPDTILLEWNDKTIQNMSEEFILKSFDQEVNWTTYYLPENALIRLDEEYNETASDWQKNQTALRILIPLLGREGRTIKRVFESNSDTSIKTFFSWLNFFHENLLYPISAVVCYEYDEDDGPLKLGDHVQITGICGFDNALGLYASVTCQDRDYVIPLQDLECSDTSKNGRNINAYSLWMVCRA